jgi:4-diphosphocytidyl-2-C-methyl-D-erythritol kinase
MTRTKSGISPHFPRPMQTLMTSPVHCKSYAKINWTLDILGRRSDGYHELRTIYQMVSLCDDLIFLEAERDIQVACDDARVPTDESNLVFKAAELLRRACGGKKGARIEITKRIPVAAGLGGGSSNAAATLLGLQRLWNVEIDDAESLKAAASLGSDVPFFLMGGTALGIGRGEEVYPIEEVNCDHLVLVNPGFAVSTASAYGMLSRLTTADAVRIIPFTFVAAKAIRELPFAASNDLEQVVLAAHPEIAEIKRSLLRIGARHAVMSGSGATVFGVFDNFETAVRARDEMRVLGYWSEQSRTVSRSEYRESLFT